MNWQCGPCGTVYKDLAACPECGSIVRMGPPAVDSRVTPEPSDRRPVLREILDAFVALFREFQSEAFEWRAGEKRPCGESIAHVATLIGKLGDCHVAAPASQGTPEPNELPHKGGL